MVGKAKFAAWSELGDLSKDDAMKKYIDIINELVSAEEPLVNDDDISTSGTSTIQRPTLTSIAYPRKQTSITELKLKTIAITLEDNGVCTVKLNRPTRGNSFNIDMWTDLRTVFEEINKDSKVRCVILTGNEKSFSTGMDLSVFQEMEQISKKENCPGRQRESLIHIIKWLQDAISGPEKCVVPVIAAINGHCIGGAVDLATACDLRYCTDDAIFSIKETDLAMVADIGTLQRLPKLIGDMQSRELTYTGRNFDGKEAEKLGLVLKSFATNEEMQSHIITTTASIAAKSPLTTRGIKSTILYTRDHTVDDSLGQIQLHNAAHLMSADLMEAMRATFMKDEPTFSGH
jgi:enoyl-CoA hydratase